MKKRLPATERALNNLLASSSISGELHAGDSIGVWTFDRAVRTGQFPLQRWVPQNAVTIASNINWFVAGQHYSKTTSFNALRPYLNWVVQNSDRLTVLIFCDGDGQIAGTPYDSGINRVFQQQQAERKKARQPFIIVLRSQLGGYVGGMMDWPPGLVSLPAFPPLPPPPNEPASAPPPPPPVVTAPPLIVIGTNAGTNLPPLAPAPPPKPEPAPPPATNPPPPAVAMPATNIITNVETNAPPPAPTNAIVTESENAPVAEPANSVAPSAVARTNAVAPPPAISGLSSKKALATGATFLILAGALAVLMLNRVRRRARGSLITRSMDRGAKPPP